jgi:hypothetical protein
MIKEFVNKMINKHTEVWNIQFDIITRNEIINHVKSGVYAFQIIYNDYSVSCKEVILVKPLDWNKVIKNSRSDVHYGQSLWSYDGGVQFKYSQRETLKLDVKLIRELKLNEILYE